jgi:hypothetical protein
MKVLSLIIFLAMTFLLACQSGANQTVLLASQSPSPTPKENPKGEESITGEQEDSFSGRATPTEIGDCLSKVKLDEPFGIDVSMNPFYLRIDLYGDRVLDYVLIIKGRNTEKLGLLICKDAKEPVLLGELANAKTPLTDMRNDNFVGAYWDVSSKEEFRQLSSRHNDKEYRAAANAKGEILVFSYAIDGVLFIWWDGKRFQSFGM